MLRFALMQTVRLFCDVARHQSFSRAAGDHGITQSAASQRVLALEKRLGVTLIDRSVRPLALTQAGEVYLRDAREILERYDDLERRVSQLRPTLHGAVRVDAIYSAGIDLLNHIKEAFEREHPGVRVDVNYRQPGEVVAAVKNEQCDFGIVSYPLTWKDEVSSVPLRDERMALVVAPRHPLASRAKMHARDLDGVELIAFEPDLPVAKAVKRYLREHGATPVVSSVFDNIDTIKSAVAVTQLAAILPKRTVHREVRAGSLAAIELEPRLSRPIGIVRSKRHRRGRSAPPTVQAFIDYLLENAGPKVDLISQIVMPASPPADLHPGTGESSGLSSGESPVELDAELGVKLPVDSPRARRPRRGKVVAGVK